mmetsp:Transcript_63765/g.75463  ORF Transcript_63765/g.75463 Transcript_63765/m.75463 type:complete len:208 (+) Transcript_63765:144-767(+)
MTLDVVLKVVSVVIEVVSFFFTLGAAGSCRYTKIHAEIPGNETDIFSEGIFWGGKFNLTDLENVPYNPQCAPYHDRTFDAPWIVAQVGSGSAIVFGFATLVLTLVFLKNRNVKLGRSCAVLCFVCCVLQSLSLFILISQSACRGFGTINYGKYVNEVPLKCTPSQGVYISLVAMASWLAASITMVFSLMNTDIEYDRSIHEEFSRLT